MFTIDYNSDTINSYLLRINIQITYLTWSYQFTWIIFFLPRISSSLPSNVVSPYQNNRNSIFRFHPTAAKTCRTSFTKQVITGAQCRSCRPWCITAYSLEHEPVNWYRDTLKLSNAALPRKNRICKQFEI